MSDKEQKTESEAQAAPVLMPGAQLKAGREQAGLSIAELAASLRLDRTVVEHLENDKFDDLPAPIFTRGYIRNYAVAVGLDPNPLCEAYDTVSKPQEQVVSQQEQPKKSSKLWLWLLLALLIAGALVWWFNGPQQEAVSTNSVVPIDVDESSAPAAEASANENDISGNTASGAATQNVSATPPVVAAFQIAGSEETAAADTEISDDSAADEVINVSTDSASAAEPEPEPVSLPATENAQVEGSSDVQQENQAQNPVNSSSTDDAVEPEAESQEREEVATQTINFRLEVSDDCWVEIKDGNGKVRVARVLKADQFRELTAIAPVKFVIGNADIASLTVAGEDYDVQRHRRASGTARFTLNAE